jgi:hypothetical protein
VILQLLSKSTSVIGLSVVAATAMTAPVTSVARDTVYSPKFADVLIMDHPKIQTRLDDSIKLYFGDQPTPKVLSTLGQNTSNWTTNGFGKDDQFGCKWAAYSALVALQVRAKHLGADAVINISSNYKNNLSTSQTEFECHAGTFVIGVALKGTFVKLAP